MNIRLHYNAPVILTFSLLCVVVFAINYATGGALTPYVSLGGNFHMNNWVDYFTLFTHCLGHANVEHLLGNLTFILLLGPVLEEKYGWRQLLIMIMLTALITGLLNALFFHDGLWGASGIVFMLVMLISFVNVQAGKIPITFILILLLFVGKEIYNSFQADNISQFAHIIGGLCGSMFGFIGKR
jgi:membrane associated rhomboid family serine protease